MKSKVLLVVVCLCSPVLAAPVRFVGTVPTDLQLGFFTDGETQFEFAIITANRHVDVVIDPAAPTSFHDPRKYSHDGASSHVLNLMRPIDGTVTLIPITVTVTLDAFSITKNNHGPFPLTFDGVDEFVEPSIAVGQPFDDLFDPFVVTGHYEISGPTETYTGSFSRPVTPFAVSGFAYRFQDFPNSITLRRRHQSVLFFDSGPVFFDGVVDGASFDIQIINVIFDADLNYSTINAVPEPSTLILAAIGLVGLAAFGWRRRKR